MKTRDRILLMARQLFNQLGYGNVTIALLAEHLTIAKGNLWYHFNDKRSLLEALTVEFLEMDKQRRKIKPEPNKVLEGYILLLSALAEEIREFRFLFRDHSDYGEHSQVMLNHLPTIHDESIAQFEQFFNAMRDAGHLEIATQQVRPLALNVILVLRYNLEFMRERQLLTKEESGSVTVTFEQHLSLFSDKLSAGALSYLENSLVNSTNREANLAV